MSVSNEIIKNISKIAFLFIVFAVIAGGVVQHVLSCQMQSFLKESETAKHIIAVILIFLFIMMEGGWDFDSEENAKAPVDWSNGNVIHSMAYALLIYMIFIITARNQLLPNIIIFSLLFIVYLINTQRLYWKRRNRISEETSKKVVKFELILLIFTAITALYGFIDYVIYKHNNLGNKFRWHRFFLNAKDCAFDGTKETFIRSSK